MSDHIKSIIKASIAAKEILLADASTIERISTVVDQIAAAFTRGRRVYFCGNGGSAADAQHLAAEFSGRFYKNRRALPAEALHCNTSYLTAVANDYSYDVIYARLVEGIMEPGDILLGFSTSGNSANIVLAFEAAREKEVVTIGFTGSKGGKLREYSDFLFNVPTDDTPRIQECHIMVGHIICEMVEAKLFS